MNRISLDRQRRSQELANYLNNLRSIYFGVPAYFALIANRDVEGLAEILRYDPAFSRIKLEDFFGRPDSDAIEIALASLVPPVLANESTVLRDAIEVVLDKRAAQRRWKMAGVGLIGVAAALVLAGRSSEKAGGSSPVAKKVFVSFDFDNDRTLKEFIIGQAKNPDSPFEVVDHSLKEAAPESDWVKRARTAITRADVVITMLGPNTRFAPGVKKEMAIAKELSKFRFQIIGYDRGTEGWAVADGGRTYRWSWPTLKQLLA